MNKRFEMDQELAQQLETGAGNLPQAPLAMPVQDMTVPSVASVWNWLRVLLPQAPRVGH